MGRELKRVPLDFSWPLNEIWKGYINPHYVECGACRGRGGTPAKQRLSELVRLILLSGSDSIRGINHPYFSTSVFNSSIVPSKDMAELTTGLAGRSPDGPFGHDACDEWSATEKIMVAAGLDLETWGVCKECDGEGVPTDIFPIVDAWEQSEPPTGDGFQLWETTSEGSPISPVFANLDELCEWAADNATTFGSFKTSADKWREMLDEDFVRHEEGNMIFI